jgi:acetolactate synthase-1/2/3 large subunit
MRDQAAMLREAVKWDYELRYPEQAELVVERALAIAHSDPMGPVYLSLPREVLAEAAPDPAPLTTRQQAARSGPPPADRVAAAVELLRSAKNPLIIAQRALADGGGAPLERLAERFAIPVVEFWATRNAIDTGHPMFAGHDTKDWLAEADVVVTIEALVPWLLDEKNSGWAAKIIALAADPLFTRTPLRSFPVDVALAGDPTLALSALAERMSAHEAEMQREIETRRQTIGRRNDERRASALARAEKGKGSPISPAWASLCLSEAKDRNAVVFNELGCDPSVMRFDAPNLLFTAALSGGLGWALPAALGFRLADRERQVIACVGDGSYIFANPVACHQVAMAQKLPVLTVVFNNGIWNAVRRATLAMYPDGAAAHSNAMPFTDLSPAPDYAAISRAHGCFGERVEDGAAFPDAIHRALEVVRRDRLPALLDVVVSPS